MKGIITILASIGFVLCVMTFIAGFRMVKRRGGRAEPTMHRYNGYITIVLYIAVAVIAISVGTTPFFIFGWFVGLMVHFFKILLVRKHLAARYGGYLGAMLLITWLTVIFTHLPD